MNRTLCGEGAVDGRLAKRALASRVMIDIPTLLGFSAAVLVSIAILLLLTRPRGGARLWLAMPFLAGACCCALLLWPALKQASAAGYIGTFFALLAFAAGWQGIRSIFHLPPRWGLLLAPPLCWLALVAAVFGPGEMSSLNAAGRAALAALYCGLSAVMLVQRRDPSLPSARLLAHILMASAALAAVATVLSPWLPEPLGAGAPRTWAVAVFSGIVLINVLLVCGLMVAVLKEQAASRLYDEATRDSLTGLYNRRLLDEKLGIWDQEDRVSGTVRAALFFDIDEFKTINDRFGHHMGDKVICQAARAAEQAVRRDDLIFRYGGEEFLCILPNSSLKAGLAAAERLRSTFEHSAQEVAGHRIDATLSVGVAISQGRRSNAGALVAAADRQMYRAKQAGRNRVMGSDGD